MQQNKYFELISQAPDFHDFALNLFWLLQDFLSCFCFNVQFQWITNKLNRWCAIWRNDSLSLSSAKTSIAVAIARISGSVDDELSFVIFYYI